MSVDIIEQPYNALLNAFSDSRHISIPQNDGKVKLLAWADSTPGTSFFKASPLNITGSIQATNQVGELLKGSSLILDIAGSLEIDKRVDEAVDKLVEAAFSQKEIRPLRRKV